MSSFAKLVAVLSAGLLATVAAADTKTADDKSKKSDATPSPKEATAKKGKKDKRKETPAPADPNEPMKPVQVPIPVGHDAKGLIIPYRDSAGNLKMRFTIGLATKVDENHMDMEQTQVETFNDQGEHEMAIDLPKSTLELATWDVTAHQAVTIKRDDFELTGNSMIFNLKTKVGGLGSDVRMTIYNLEDSTSQTPDGEKPAVAPAAGQPAAAPAPAAQSRTTTEPKAK